MLAMGVAMRTLCSIVAVTLLAVIAVAGPAVAEDKKDKKGSSNFDDLFGPSPQKNNLDAMKKATDNMGAKTGSKDLAPKADNVTQGDASVKLLNAFAATKIVQDKKLGCQPGGRDKKKLSEWTFDEVPAKASQGFEVCLTLASQAGREMRLNVAIVDSRNSRVATAEDVLDFRGKPKIDHVLEYPAPTFKMAGQYFYVVDLDGKEVGRMPLFQVKLDGDTAGAPGNPMPEKAVDAPATARDNGGL
jgi:hypothetical protein